MTLDQFFPYILPEVPGCPEPTLNLNIVMAAIDFCRETLAWSEIKAPIPLVDAQRDYTIAPVTDSYVVGVRDVWVSGFRLKPMTMAALQEQMTNWDSAQSTLPTFYNSVAARGSIRVYPIPTNPGTNAMTVRAAYAPTPGCTTLPDFLANSYMDVIASGAKARIMLQPGKTWSNPELGAFYKLAFDDGVVRARVDEAHDRSPGTVRVAARPFGF